MPDAVLTQKSLPPAVHASAEIRAKLLEAPVRMADRVDAFARRTIVTAGILVIASVFAIVVFIGLEALPLLKPNVLGETRTTVEANAVAAGVDEYRQLIYLVERDATIRIAPVAGGAGAGESLPLEGLEGGAIVTSSPGSEAGTIVSGTSDGRVAVHQVRFVPEFEGHVRKLVPRPSLRGVVAVAPGRPITQAAADRDEEGNLRVAAIAAGSQSVTLGTVASESEPRLVEAPGLEADVLTMSDRGPTLAVARGSHVQIHDWSDLAQLRPSASAEASGRATSLRFVIGGDTLLVGLEDGRIEAWSRVLVRGEGLVLERIGAFGAGSGTAVVAMHASTRNKSFLVLHEDGLLRLLHLTTRRELASARVAATGFRELASTKVASTAFAASFAPKADGAVVLDGKQATLLSLVSPHPEVSLRTLLRPVWYESYPAPAHVWQTSGGTDDVEPKFGLVPLFFGTLKGTLYAMLFSAPLAILAALYLAQLAPSWLRNVVKPSLELMAAIPSVVVGFIAALWLAPRIERNLLGIALAAPAIVAVVLAVQLAVGLWLRARERRLAPGAELFWVAPSVLAGCVLASFVAPAIEGAWFDGDIRQWLFENAGLRYDQRNSIVVGIALGFAVVPVIFTIAEDAFSSVPPSLTSAALALGCTPWQTALHVVLPAAAPGVFAAMMLGFGRALGETMIVLMATGNTPVLDILPFNGMRTMSAAIAVEIPEAAAGGTQYRVLFLVGLLLFGFAFCVNTVADVVSTRLRRRFGRL